MEHHGHSNRSGRSSLSKQSLSKQPGSKQSGHNHRHSRGRGSGGAGRGPRQKRRGGCLEFLVAILLLLIGVLAYRSGWFNKMGSTYNWNRDGDSVNWEDDGDTVESPSDLPSEMPPAPERGK